MGQVRHGWPRVRSVSGKRGEIPQGLPWVGSSRRVERALVGGDELWKGACGRAEAL
jgi:hypothetical protein